MDMNGSRSSDPRGLVTAERVREKALALGASLAGVAGADAISRIDPDLLSGQPAGWRGEDVSVIIIALEHPEANPELDWWKQGCPGGAEGNRELISIIEGLCEWLAKQDIETKPLPYQAGDGGTFLKHAAVLGGLGCLGKNNLLVTPEYGPRVRLRAMLIKIALTGVGIINFDPCRDCSMPCREACPQNAFGKSARTPAPGANQLPAGDGAYQRALCQLQMEQDERNAETIKTKPGRAAKPVRYCRRCELACPVGAPA